VLAVFLSCVPNQLPTMRCLKRQQIVLAVEKYGSSLAFGACHCLHDTIWFSNMFSPSIELFITSKWGSYLDSSHPANGLQRHLCI